MNNYDFEKVILNGQLKNFMVGFGIYKTTRPEDATNNWDELEKYYSGLSEDSIYKGRIKEEVENLFIYGNEAEKRIGLILCRLLGIAQIELALLKYLEHHKLSSLKDPFRTDIWVTICHFQFDSLSQKMAEFIVAADLMKTYLLTSNSRLSENIASDDDIWRVRVINNYYINSSTIVRKKIESQFATIKGKSKKIESIFKSYILKHSDENLVTFLTSHN